MGAKADIVTPCGSDFFPQTIHTTILQPTHMLNLHGNEAKYELSRSNSHIRGALAEPCPQQFEM